MGEPVSEIVVLSISVDQRTGHITMSVRTRTKNGNAEWYGPTRNYGADAATFRGRFSGDMKQFTAWVASEHKMYVGAHAELTESLMKLQGQVIG